MDKEIQRSILMFENGCSSDYTRNMYRSKLDQFRKHFHIKDFDSLIRMSILELKEMVEDHFVPRKEITERKIKPEIPKFYFSQLL